MSDERWPQIEASLRRSFEPPALEALEARVTRAAGQPAEHDAGTAVSDSPWRRTLGLAMAVAAAVALVWWVGSRPPPRVAPQRATERTTERPAIAMAPRLTAGRQLDAFLAGGRALPAMDADCAMLEAPPSCEGTERQPQLVPDFDVQLLGECGGATGVSCADHDLPAQRAMLVRLEPSGAEAIVCIEPPWADPKPVMPEGSGYNIFRRQVGSYVLYEVTPQPAPQALETFAIPG